MASEATATVSPTGVKDFTKEVETPSSNKWIKDFTPLSMDHYLDSDPVDNHGDASFTGVWHSAEKLLDYLENQSAELFPTGSSVLELGSGTGWLGITLARNLQETLENHVLTDSTRTGAVTWTQQNVEEAKKQGVLSDKCPITVTPMDWGNEKQVTEVAQQHPWHIIVGSDLIYSEEGAEALSKCMARLLKENPNTRLIYAHTQGRIPPLDDFWQEQLRLQRLSCTILASEHLWDERRTVIMQMRLKKE